MKKLIIIIAICLLPVIGLATMMLPIIATNNSEQAGESYDFHDPLEQPGTCETWVDEDSMTFNYSANPISGTYSLHLSDTGADIFDLPSAVSEVYFAFEIERNQDTASDQPTIVTLENSSGGDLCFASRRDNGQIRLYNTGGASFAANLATAGLGNTTYVKIRCKAGTGENAETEMWTSTDGISWSSAGSNSAGTWTDNIDQIRVRGSTADVILLDELRTKTTDIATVNEDSSSCP